MEEQKENAFFVLGGLEASTQKMLGVDSAEKNVSPASKDRENCFSEIKKSDGSDIFCGSANFNDSSDFRDEGPKLRRMASRLKLKSSSLNREKKLSNRIAGLSNTKTDKNSVLPSAVPSLKRDHIASAQKESICPINEPASKYYKKEPIYVKQEDIPFESKSSELAVKAENPVTQKGSEASLRQDCTATSCILCGYTVLKRDYERHRSSCLREKFTISSVPREDSTLNTDTKCDICHRIISGMNSRAQSLHINNCLDKVEKEKKAEEEHKQKLILARKSVLSCPLCRQKFKTQQGRKGHLKKCAKDNGVTVERLRLLMKQQEEDYASKLDAGILPEEFVATRRKTTETSKTKRVTQPRTTLDEDTQLALALSNSLAEDNGHPHADFLQPVMEAAASLEAGKAEEEIPTPSQGLASVQALLSGGAKSIPKGKKGKQIGITSALLNLPREEAAERISRRVDNYIFSHMQREPLAKTPPFKIRSKQQYQCTAGVSVPLPATASSVTLNLDSIHSKTLWSKACLEEKFGIDPVSQLQQDVDLEKTAGVAMSTTHKLEYYVPALMPPITMCCVTTGSKIKRVSAIPGRRKSGSNTEVCLEEENIQEVIYADAEAQLNEELKSSATQLPPSQTVQDLALLALENDVTADQTGVVSGSTQLADSVSWNQEGNSGQRQGGSDCLLESVDNTHYAEMETPGFNRLLPGRVKRPRIPRLRPPEFGAFVNNSRYSDVTILAAKNPSGVSGNNSNSKAKIYAHKLILYVQCSKMLLHCERREDGDYIDLSEFDEDAVLSLMRFIYKNGGICWEPKNRHQLYQLAQRFSLDTLARGIRVYPGDPACFLRGDGTWENVRRDSGDSGAMTRENVGTISGDSGAMARENVRRDSGDSREMASSSASESVESMDVSEAWAYGNANIDDEGLRSAVEASGVTTESNSIDEGLRSAVEPSGVTTESNSIDEGLNSAVEPSDVTTESNSIDEGLSSAVEPSGVTTESNSISPTVTMEILCIKEEKPAMAEATSGVMGASSLYVSDNPALPPMEKISTDCTAQFKQAIGHFIKSIDAPAEASMAVLDKAVDTIRVKIENSMPKNEPRDPIYIPCVSDDKYISSDELIITGYDVGEKGSRKGGKKKSSCAGEQARESQARSQDTTSADIHGGGSTLKKQANTSFLGEKYSSLGKQSNSAATKGNNSSSGLRETNSSPLSQECTRLADRSGSPLRKGSHTPIPGVTPFNTSLDDLFSEEEASPASKKTFEQIKLPAHGREQTSCSIVGLNPQGSDLSAVSSAPAREIEAGSGFTIVTGPNEADIIGPNEADATVPDEADVIGSNEADIIGPDEADVIGSNEADILGPNETDVIDPNEADIIGPNEADITVPNEAAQSKSSAPEALSPDFPQSFPPTPLVSSAPSLASKTMCSPCSSQSQTSSNGERSLFKFPSSTPKISTMQKGLLKLMSQQPENKKTKPRMSTRTSTRNHQTFTKLKHSAISTSVASESSVLSRETVGQAFPLSCNPSHTDSELLPPELLESTSPGKKKTRRGLAKHNSPLKLRNQDGGLVSGKLSEVSNAAVEESVLSKPSSGAVAIQNDENWETSSVKSWCSYGFHPGDVFEDSHNGDEFTPSPIERGLETVATQTDQSREPFANKKQLLQCRKSLAFDTGLAASQPGSRPNPETLSALARGGAASSPRPPDLPPRRAHPEDSMDSPLPLWDRIQQKGNFGSSAIQRKPSGVSTLSFDPPASSNQMPQKSGSVSRQIGKKLSGPSSAQELNVQSEASTKSAGESKRPVVNHITDDEESAKTADIRSNKAASTPKKKHHTKMEAADKKVPSPFTPMPPYDTMNTPELNKAVEAIGVRPLNKKRNIGLLKSVYDQTHQYETDSDYEPTPVKRPPADGNRAAYKESAGPSCSYGSSSLPRSVNLSDNISEEDHLSEDSSHSEGPDFPEESIHQGWPEEEAPVNHMSLLSAVVLTDKLTQFIKDNEDINLDVLMYRPLELDVLKKRLAEAGIQVGMNKLMDFLNEKYITFTMKNMSTRNNRHRKEPKKKNTNAAKRTNKDK